jgi:hypothetical protein
MHKTDVERLFLMLLGERLLVEREKKNKMGFTNSYLAVSKDPASKRKLNSLAKQPLIMSMSKNLPRSKEAAPRAKKPATSQGRSKIVSMQVGKPVRSGGQTFVDEEDEDEEEIETIGGTIEEEDEDGVTIGTKSTRSVDSSTESRNKSRSRNRSNGYGDETDGTYTESGDEADSSVSDGEVEGDGASEVDEDEVEVVHGIKDNSDAYDSDIELVPTQAAAPTPKVKPKARTAKGRATSKGATDVSDIREHYTRHIFFSLQEIAQEVRFVAQPIKETHY